MATKPEIERLAVVETKVDSLALDIKDVKDDVKDIKTAFEQLTIINDRRYAAKWVQTALSFVVGIIVATVIGALLALILIPGYSGTPNTTLTNMPSGTTSQTTASHTTTTTK